MPSTSGTSRRVLAGSLIGLGLAVVGVLSPDRPAGRARTSWPRSTTRSAIPRARRPAQRHRATSSSPSSCWRRSRCWSASAGSGSCSRARARSSSASRPGSVTASCRVVFIAPAVLLLGIYLVYPAVVTVIGSFQDEDGAFTLANWASLADTSVPRDPSQQHPLAPRGDERQRGPRACSSPPSSTASGASRWPRPSSSCRWPSRSSARPSSGSSSTPGSPPSQPQIRAPERHLDGIRRRADRLGHDLPHQPPGRDRDPDLAPDGLRHGRVLGGDQGRVDRGHRGGQARRRLRASSSSSGSIVPMIRGSIVTVTTTIAIVTLKIFDIVYVDQRAARTTTTWSRCGCSRRCSSSSTMGAPRRWRPSCSSPCCR